MIINALCGVKAGTQTVLFSGGWDKVVKRWRVTKDGAEEVENLPLDMTINTMTCGNFGIVYAGGSDGHIVSIEF